MRECFLTACELLEHYKNPKSKITPLTVIKDIIKRYQETKSLNLNFLTQFETEENLIKQATESSKRWEKNQPVGKLDGIPVTIKDILEVKGWKTCYGALSPDDVKTDEFDCPCVERIKKAGGIILGKTTTPTFGWKGVTDSPIWGYTGNPHHPDKTAGGSSGGCAVAVQLGIGCVSMGTDGAGSVRIPASFCGITTIKPTYGRIAHLLSKFGTLSTIGPMTRSIEDCLLTLNVVGNEPHHNDWYSYPLALKNVEGGKCSDLKLLVKEDDEFRKKIKNTNIAFTGDFGGMSKVHPEVKDVFDKTIEKLKGHFTNMKNIAPDFSGINVYDTFKTTWIIGMQNTLEHLKKDGFDEKKLEKEFLNIAKEGKSISGLDVRVAENNRAKMGTLMNKFHLKYPILLSPTLPIPAFDKTREVPKDNKYYNTLLDSREDVKKDINRWWSWTPFTYLFNQTKQPAVSIPCGFTKSEKLPVGLQIVSSLYNEEFLLNVAHYIEEVLKK